jgi:hypothetical protein
VLQLEVVVEVPHLEVDQFLLHPMSSESPQNPDLNGSSCWKDSSKGKREAILDLSKYVNERIRVKFTGGREGS